MRALGSDPDQTGWERGEDAGRQEGTGGFPVFPSPPVSGQALVHRASDT